MPQTFKAVFFDAGGTLFRPFPSVGEIYSKAASLYGVSHDPERLEAKFHQAWKSRGGLSSLGDETNEEKERAWWHSLVHEVFEPYGGVPSFEVFFKALHRSFEEKELWEIYPEVPEVLNEIRNRGLIMGVVSNWDLRLPKVIRNLGLHHHFDFLVGSSMCGATKPSEKIFKEALKQAGVKPEEAIHVGDTYEEDFIGAERLGIRAVHLDRNGGNHSVPEHATVKNLRELLDRF
jgi:putative hydrolase of the HAD superfamily